MKISLIIPAYNEEKRISAPLKKAISYMEEKYPSDYEIVVVDDGSSDDTVGTVKKIQADTVRVIEQGMNKGKGAAVRRGMLESEGDYRIFTDADFSTPVEEVEKAMKYLESETDVFIGSRALDHSFVKKHQPFYREFMGKVFNKIVQVVVLWGIKDTQCGFKGLKSEAAKKIFSLAKFDGFSFDVELLYLARKLGYNISEVPVTWYNDERTTVSAISDSAQMFLDIIRIKRAHRGV
jgi:dolichyl-phosphate beta-glucosyltransferase